MRISYEFSEQYKPWMGAEDTYDKIAAVGKLNELEVFLEAHFGSDCIDATEVNDLLWFEDELVLNALGLADDDAEQPELPVNVQTSLADMGIDPDDFDSYEALETEVTESAADYLSDEYGFAVNGCVVEVNGDNVHITEIDWDTSKF